MQNPELIAICFCHLYLFPLLVRYTILDLAEVEFNGPRWPSIGPDPIIYVPSCGHTNFVIHTTYSFIEKLFSIKRSHIYILHSAQKLGVVQ